MAINVVRYGNATKPVMASEKESTNPVGQVINALGSAFETGYKFYDRVGKVRESEEDASVVKDLSVYSKKLQESIEKDRISGRTDSAKRASEYSKKEEEKFLKDKSARYRKKYSEGATKLRDKYIAKAFENDLENATFKTMDDLQDTVNYTADTVGTDIKSTKEASNGISSIISNAAVSEHLKPKMIKQAEQKLYGSTIEKLIKENPIVARSLIENDEDVSKVFSEKERHDFLRDCDESAFNNLANKDVNTLVSLFDDEKAVKETFPTFDLDERREFKKKAQKLKDQQIKRIQAEEKYMKASAYTAFMKAPSFKEYKRLEESGLYKAKELEKAKERLDFVQQEDVNTLNNEFIPALNENLKAWAKLDPDSPEAKTELMNQVANAIYQMGVYNNKGILSANDMNSYTQKITDIFAGDFYREFQEARPYMEKHINQAIELNKMQHLKFGDDLYLGDIFQTTFLSKAEREKRLMKTVNYTAQAFLEFIARGETDNALKVIADGEDRAFKEWYPEYANLNEGDSVIVKGMVMKYKGRNGLIPIIEVD